MKKADIRIVVLQRGWVLVGRFSKRGQQGFLDGASVIRYWGTERGIGQLAKDGPTEKTKLDPCNGQVEFHALTVVATFACAEGPWSPLVK